MSELIRLSEIAKRLDVGIDTIRRTISKIGDELGISVQRESRSSRAQCLPTDQANALIRYFEERDRQIAATTADQTTPSYSAYGFFYIIQLIPELEPNRVKIGYTDNLETRLVQHQTSAPTARYAGTWSCKRAWDQAAMDSITRKDCVLVLNEVYEGDLKLFVERANEFFALMPDKDTTVPLSAHSPITNPETEA